MIRFLHISSTFIYEIDVIFYYLLLVIILTAIS